MKLIVGLGNPGKEYEATRHNVGFWALDHLSKTLDGEALFSYKKRLESDVFEARLGDEKVVLVKPQTFMNKSGEAIAKAVSFYKVELSDVIVVCDDTYLKVGSSRVRFGGESGGHNGLISIIELLGAGFWRVRIGIGEQGELKLEDYVLQKMPANEKKTITESIDIVVKDMVESISKEKLENKTYQITNP